MDLNTIIIGLIIITVIFVPLVYIQMSQNIQKKKAKNKFIADATSNNIHVSGMDFWGTYYAIALDKEQKKLVYSKKTDEETVWITLNLNDVNNCHIDKVDRQIKNQTTNKIETDSINLVIRTKDKKDIVLEFYNIDVNIEMTEEKALLEKWQTLIKQQLVASKIAA